MQETRTQTVERIMRRQKTATSQDHWGPPGLLLYGAANRPMTDAEMEQRPFCHGRVRSLYGRHGKPTRWYRAGWLCDGCGAFAPDFVD